MFRREVLQGVIAAGVAGVLAGCGSSEPSDQESHRPPEAPAGGQPEEEDSFRIAGMDYHEDDAGNLVVVVSVRNDGDGSRTGTLETTVKAGGESYIESTDVSVEGGQTEDVEVAFEVSFEAFEEDGSINVDLS